MAYDCQSCNYKFSVRELSEDTFGERQCPECGSYDILENGIEDDPGISDEDLIDIQNDYDPNVSYDD
jgi:DNA-directed RNA polymerase subunit RPC12/RpoP